jgi:hypothetical protein
MFTLPAPAEDVRREVQRLLGFTGKDVDGDFGKTNYHPFQ